MVRKSCTSSPDNVEVLEQVDGPVVREGFPVRCA